VVVVVVDDEEEGKRFLQRETQLTRSPHCYSVHCDHETEEASGEELLLPLLDMLVELNMQSDSDDDVASVVDDQKRRESLAQYQLKRRRRRRRRRKKKGFVDGKY